MCENSSRGSNNLSLYPSVLGVDMTSDHDELNFENLVRFYGEELQMLIQGEVDTKIFSPRVRRLLRGEGILVYRNKEWGITEDAKKVLSTM